MKRILSVLLALVMVIGMLPMSILSASAAAAGDAVTYTFSQYTAGTQYAQGEEHILDDTVTLTINGAHLNTQVRLYSGSNAVLTSELTITSATFTAGNKAATLKIYASTDGTTFTLCEDIKTTSSYKDYTVDVPDDTVAIKMESDGAQIRVSKVKLTFGAAPAGACSHADTTSTTVDATCTEAGSITTVCNSCGKTMGIQDIAATGHKYENGSCTVCGEAAPADLSGKYYIAAKRSADGSTYYYMTSDLGTANTKRYTAVDSGLTELPDKITTPNDGYVFELIRNDSTGLYTICADGVENGYLNWTSGNSGTLVAADSAKNMTVEATESGSYNVHFTNGTEERYLSLNNTSGSDYFAFYIGTQVNDLCLIPVAQSGEVEPEEPEQPAGEHDSHDTGIAEEKAPTCTEPGNTAGMFCNDCEVFFDGAEVIPALGHNYVDGACSVCGDAEPTEPEQPAEDVKIVFELGANGSAAHNDGSAKTEYTETVDGYTLAITATDKMYTGAFDLTGNSCIKLGTGSVVGGFSFKVPDNVTEVVILVAKYKANTSKVTVNGTEYSLTKNSNDGAYDEITVDTSTSKTVTITTVSGASRAMVNSITFVPSADGESDHECVWDEGAVTTEPTCLAEGVKTYTCTVEGCEKFKTEAIAKIDHIMTNGTCSMCGAEYYTLSTTLNNNDSVVIYYPSSKVAMTATASGTKLSGTTATIDESGLLTNNNLAIMQVQYINETDFYLICDGKYLTSGATGQSLTFAAEDSDYAVWYIEVVENGDSTVYIHNRNAVYNGGVQSLEFYSGFTTFGTKTTEAYWFQLYTKGENDIACEHAWSDWEIVTNATCTTAGEQKSVCANCGEEKTQTIAATGHTYVFGDEAVTCTAGDVNVAKSEIGNVPKTADANVYYVEGIVTFVDGGTVYIQDATGGVALRLANSVSAPKVGDKVEAVGSCSVYNGLIQLQNAYFETVSSGNTVEAQAVTLAELKADTDLTYLSVKVAMKGLTVTAAENYNATYKNVDYTVTDGTNFFKLYRAPAASADTVLKAGDVINVVGVVGIYNADYQLRVVDASDIVIAPTVKMTHISLDPTNDALGFKVQLNGIDPAEVTEYGVTFTVNGMSKTYTKNSLDSESISARVQGIMEAGGGEMKITGQFYVVVNGEKIYSDEQTTCMMDAIKAVNEITTLSEAQKAAVYGLYTDYASVIDAWLGETNKIKDWAPVVV